ncbi:purine nucleoside phosphorylase I, inosine and guanosine-specific [Caldalkalibacillus thermarum TA2.A1]|uniref:Purine nucleoside phosphorylase n=1 Tax=Caldalkalibacillus thermarum (strain TA2.A1) TaxID=986075 RepID=F5L875_CALTT|nr:purine-nucleoside phosphorylase [Caldalkalibacillus thermarum]EGL82488.1 purine nucleoside phosphorylase I, inosine and guanosine-specific [Caldalkalibacillus thermarum TA2.A1]QZT33165.1 purine-nucleoside phosphorylase [Caldalkalibacillus thermarum TA2.A1]
MRETYSQAADYLRDKLNVNPDIGLILGSGLGVLADEIENPVKIPYREIPGFPESTVAGHAGQLVSGVLEGRPVIAMQGRFHFYEGYDLQLVTMPVRAMKKLGVSKLVVTNAAGGINPDFSPGDLMLIESHINFMFQNPLIGPNDDELGPRFPDMSQAYTPQLREKAEKVANELGIPLQKGVYVGVTGPSYETPAEIRMFRKMGADAVGMSTVPEVIVAAHCGMEVLGISCISNMAAGILDQPLSHEEVMETAERVKQTFLTLVKGIVKQL